MKIMLINDAKGKIELKCRKQNNEDTYLVTAKLIKESNKQRRKRVNSSLKELKDKGIFGYKKAVEK